MSMRCSYSVLLGLGLLLGCLNEGRSADRLVSDFITPPDQARPWVWTHWLHGNIDAACITRELTAIKRVGLGGVTIFDVAQPGIPAGSNPYFSPAWQELFAHEIREAKRLGLEVMSHNGPGYSGNGGPWMPLELSAQQLVTSATRITGGGRVSVALAKPKTNGDFYRDVAVLALAETEQQASYQLPGLDLKRLHWVNYIKYTGTRSADLTATAPPAVCIPRTAIQVVSAHLAADGTFTWEAPAGNWTILRLGHGWTGQKTLPATPDSQGPECDKLAKRGIQHHFSVIMDKLAGLAGDELGKTFTSFFVDSWEAGGQNWTEAMPAEFRRRRGYDPIPWLPVITGRVVGDLQQSERFLYDLRQTVSELMVENFWAEMLRLCHARGIKLATEAYITTGNDLDAAAHCDEPMGELWTRNANRYEVTVKSAASVAHLRGQSVVGVEAFTATQEERWQSHPAMLKPIADHLFCLGANRLQVHRFAMQRFPGLKPGMMMGGWGQQYDSTQTWWEWSKPWHDYLARCQFLLRQGRLVTDVLQVVPEEPLYRFDHQPIPGFDYDACGPDQFRSLRMIGDRPGFTPDLTYGLIVVAHTGTMTLPRLRQIRELLRAGATVLAEPPQATPGLDVDGTADAELRRLATEVWGTANETERRVGQGRLLRGLTPAAALARIGVAPDLTSDVPVEWTHRRDADGERWFIANGATSPVTAQLTLRAVGKVAERWDPLTGEITPLVFRTEQGSTRLSLPLPAHGSAFVVLRATPSATKAPAPIRETTERANVSGPWTVSFPADAGVDAPRTFASLSSWSEHPEAAVRGFAGTATYRRSLDLPAVLPAQVTLDLGRVEVMARVRLNGQDLGIFWLPPYRVDLTPAARSGANDLEVEVVNLWVNRLITDQNLPDDGPRDAKGRLAAWPEWILAGKPSPTGRRSFMTFPLWKKTDLLVPAGLLGPVMLEYAR